MRRLSPAVRIVGQRRRGAKGEGRNCDERGDDGAFRKHGADSTEPAADLQWQCAARKAKRKAIGCHAEEGRPAYVRSVRNLS